MKTENSLASEQGCTLNDVLFVYVCECYSSMAYSGKGEGFSTTRFPLCDGTGAGFLKYCDRDQ